MSQSPSDALTLSEGPTIDLSIFIKITVAVLCGIIVLGLSRDKSSRGRGEICTACWAQYSTAIYSQCARTQ